LPVPRQCSDLGRYTHRVAIANSRLIALADGQVSFRWRDYRHHDKNKVMTLATEEFIRRFLLHTLPDGFHRIRHYGFLAPRRRADKLALCRQLLSQPVPLPARDRMECQPLFIDRCPCCGGQMKQVGIVLRSAAVKPAAAHDSS
jgi:Putative transposase